MCPHLAGLLVHVEGADDALSDVPTRALHQVLGQAVGQVGLASATGPREDEAAVLQQEADVVLHHGLGDECFEHQAVHTLLFQACGQGRAEGPHSHPAIPRDSRDMAQPWSPCATLTFERHNDAGQAPTAQGQLRGLRVQHPLDVADAVAVDRLGAEPQRGCRIHLGDVILHGGQACQCPRGLGRTWARE